MRSAKFLMLASTLMFLVGCRAKIDRLVHFDDRITVVRQEKDYTTVVGRKAIYCVRGRYRFLKMDLHPGEGHDERGLFVFPIKELVGKYPDFNGDPTILQEIVKQEKLLRKFFNEREVSPNNGSDPNLQSPDPEQTPHLRGLPEARSTLRISPQPSS